MSSLRNLSILRTALPNRNKNLVAVRYASVPLRSAASLVRNQEQILTSVPQHVIPSHAPKRPSGTSNASTKDKIDKADKDDKTDKADKTDKTDETKKLHQHKKCTIRCLPKKIIVGKRAYEKDDMTNVTPHIMAFLHRRLLRIPQHPLAILLGVMEKKFSKNSYRYYRDFDRIVTPQRNFDELGMPQDHPGRLPTDTYYLNSEALLRTHTSACQISAFREAKKPGYLISGDVYRRDEIDSSHYPVFHQLEGAYTWPKSDKNLSKTITKKHAPALERNQRKQQLNTETSSLAKAASEQPDIIIVEDLTSYNCEKNPIQEAHYGREQDVAAIVADLKFRLENVFREIFCHVDYLRPESGDRIKLRWTDDEFAFTSPSFQLEMFWKGKWLELLGCGIVRQHVLDRAGRSDSMGWAFGIGLDRLAMVLFDIPDIRLMWSTDERFISQFKPNVISRFQPFSKYPPCYMDISFWIPQDRSFVENDFMETIRETAGDLVESVKLVRCKATFF